MQYETGKWMIALTGALFCGFGAGRLDAATPRYKAAQVKEGGTIVGVVRFDGTPPARKTLKIITKDPACHREPILSEDLVVSEKNTIRWAVASIKGIASGKPFPEPNPDKPLELVQNGCRFVPHVVVVPKRQTLAIHNRDGILHNVHVHARRNRPFNRAQPGKAKQIDVSFRRAERIRVGCDIHNWMASWIVVADHPYTVVTQEDGTFRLTDVPPGRHRVEIWHETLGTREQEVTVTAGSEARVDFVFKKE